MSNFGPMSSLCHSNSVAVCRQTTIFDEMANPAFDTLDNVSVSKILFRPTTAIKSFPFSNQNTLSQISPDNSSFAAVELL